MRTLLKELDLESFILYLRHPIKQRPVIDGFETQLVDESTLEVSLHHKQNLNTLFEELSKLGIEISSMRSKTNRLEELFLQLTSKN
jgi:ABC-2 type transport system ATP-binding protein